MSQPQEPYSQDFVFLQFTNGPNKLKFFSLTSLSAQVKCDSLACLYHSEVTKKVKLCELVPKAFVICDCLLNNVFF